MTDFIPSEYFGIKDSKSASLLDEIYKLTKVCQEDTEMEEGEIEVEEDEPTSQVGQEISFPGSLALPPPWSPHPHHLRHLLCFCPAFLLLL